MTTAGWRALLARATARLRATAGSRGSRPPSDPERAGFRSLLARARGRLPAAADARNGDAAAGSVLPTASGRGNLKPKCSSPRCKVKDHMGKVPREKVQNNISEAVLTKNKKLSVEGSPKVSPQKLQRKTRNMQNIPAPPKKTGLVEKIVQKAENQVRIALRISNIFKKAAQALGGITMATSLILYHKDKLVENFMKAKEAEEETSPSEEPAPLLGGAPASGTKLQDSHGAGDQEDGSVSWLVSLRQFLFRR